MDIEYAWRTRSSRNGTLFGGPTQPGAMVAPDTAKSVSYICSCGTSFFSGSRSSFLVLSRR